MFLTANKKEPRNASVENVIEYLEYVINLVGIDHIGSGSKFDGVKVLPKGLKDVSMYANLIFHLLKRGYAKQEIERFVIGIFLAFGEQTKQWQMI